MGYRTDLMAGKSRWGLAINMALQYSAVLMPAVTHPAVLGQRWPRELYRNSNICERDCAEVWRSSTFIQIIPIAGVVETHGFHGRVYSCPRGYSYIKVMFHGPFEATSEEVTLVRQLPHFQTGLPPLRWRGSHADMNGNDEPWNHITIEAYY